jgi:hypothetical protein
MEQESICPSSFFAWLMKAAMSSSFAHRRRDKADVVFELVGQVGDAAAVPLPLVVSLSGGDWAHPFMMTWAIARAVSSRSPPEDGPSCRRTCP